MIYGCSQPYNLERRRPIYKDEVRWLFCGTVRISGVTNMYIFGSNSITVFLIYNLLINARAVAYRWNLKNSASREREEFNHYLDHFGKSEILAEI